MENGVRVVRCDREEQLYALVFDDKIIKTCIDRERLEYEAYEMNKMIQNETK